MQDTKRLWENDLGEEMPDDQWKTVLDLVNTSSFCTRHILIQLKIVLRAHLIKARLAKIFPNIDSSCPRCHGKPADYMHMFWSCPKFCPKIFSSYSKMFQKDICPSPICALFGYIPETDSPIGSVIAFTSLIARRLILLSWKEKTPPNFMRWIRWII